MGGRNCNVNVKRQKLKHFSPCLHHGCHHSHNHSHLSSSWSSWSPTLTSKARMQAYFSSCSSIVLARITSFLTTGPMRTPAYLIVFPKSHEKTLYMVFFTHGILLCFKNSNNASRLPRVDACMCKIKTRNKGFMKK